DVIGRHPGRAGMVADDRAHGRGIESADPARAQAETRQCIRDVVFAPADPHFQQGRELDAAMLRRREAKHAFAQRNEIKPAIFGVADLHARRSYKYSVRASSATHYDAKMPAKKTKMRS